LHVPPGESPLSALVRTWWCAQAGLPPGVLNVVHGTHDVVNRICDHPTIRAVSFVGSDAAGKHIYTRASAQGKRVQVG
jgi:malonate-semialdehyde dehydrogenase (acetylating)/methylmalonate-semialdehyde dehydrogenase